MDLHALAGAFALACLPLAILYPAGNRIWGGDPRKVIGKKPWSGRRIVILLLLPIAAALGSWSAALGGALVPLLFLAWRAIVPSGNWATPRTSGEIAVALAHNAIPAAIVALTVFTCSKNAYACPWEWPLAITLAAHATLATALAIRYAHREAELAAQLAGGRITSSECDDEIAEANALTELLQGGSFAVAVIVWTLLR